MPDVVIEGTLTPAVGVLARGEQRTVALTDHVQTLIDNGFVKVVEYIDTPELPPVVETPPAPKAAPKSRKVEAEADDGS